METITDLQDQTLKALHELVQITQDSGEGFNHAADAIENEFLSGLFRDMAQQRWAFSEQLRNYVEINGEDADTDGSWKAKFHRWWLDIRAKLTDGDAYTVLAEAERGEDEIKETYENLIKETTGSAVNDVLHQQYAEVKRGHDRIRDLRDAYKAMKD